ncbi:bifunctional DNA-binding transcriptional dual regulator/O6-methylguanine-DNA methyltransferase [Ralstonia solanacearum]|nr:bifunctional DNA-binding transcriptional dual regulator/O6-methylguanine-DNA methyltransferase [Ralstonia solanacearum]NKA93152.1 bifunctional DNA-binding transcriptional dual regulator/O6-methylguanine-DNA methyltransferase [Ralstonia solanacearum]
MKPSTERGYACRIARVIRAIVADPGAPHTGDSLAAVAHLSPYHFHRIYRTLTGESIATTVQRVRLAQAALGLARADSSVMSITLDAGYESPQAFAHPFRRYSGVSPSAFPTRQRHLATSHLGAGADAPHVELVQLPPTDVLCLHREGPIATAGLTFRKLVGTVREDGAVPQNLQRIGLCHGDPEVPDDFRYLTGIVPTTPVELGGAIERVQVAGGLYASHRLVGPYALISPTFETLFGGWLPNSGYLPDDPPALELYRSPPQHPPHAYVTDLLIPIRKG